MDFAVHRAEVMNTGVCIMIALGSVRHRQYYSSVRKTYTRRGTWYAVDRPILRYTDLPRIGRYKLLVTTGATENAGGRDAEVDIHSSSRPDAQSLSIETRDRTPSITTKLYLDEKRRLKNMGNHTKHHMPLHRGDCTG